MKIASKKNYNNLLILGLITIVYLPYILLVGFGQGDDFFHVNFIEQNPSIIENIKVNLSMSPARPIASIILGFMHSIVRNNIVIYNLISFCLWITSALILKNCFKIIVNKDFAKIFFIIFSFPYLCFSIFIGNTMWSGYILFIFFWSIAFYFQIKFYKKNDYAYQIAYLFFLIISLFTFELIISLLIINCLVPLIFKMDKIKFLLNFIIILLFSVFFLFFKTYLLPNLFDFKIYGFSEINLKTFLQGIYFFYAISFENAILLLNSLKHSLNFTSFFIFLFIFFIFRNFKKRQKLKKHFIFIIFFLSLLSCFLIFFISGYPAVTYGHYNKTLVPAFLSLSFIISYIILYFKFNKHIVIMLIFLIVNSTYIQINNYADATTIKKDLIKKLSTYVKKYNVTDEDIILVNSPLFVENNYNNEEIVFTTWDIKFRILNTTKKNTNFWLINDRLINNLSYYPVANFMNSNYLRNDFIKQPKLFYYEYNDKLNNFEVLNSKEDVLIKIEHLKDRKINSDNYILREKIREQLKKIILDLI